MSSAKCLVDHNQFHKAGSVTTASTFGSVGNIPAIAEI
jgi:hypothetical protein